MQYGDETMKRLLLLVLTLLALPFSAMAQTAAPPEVGVALADLNARIGAALTLETVDNWTWSEEFFNDASLGCPQPDQMYAQVLTRGLVITFTQDDVLYDYRAPSGSGTAFLCSITDLTAVTPEATPETTLPLTGEVINAANAGLLTEQAQAQGNFAAIMAYSPTGNTIAVAGLTIPDPARNTAPAVLLYNAHDLSQAPEPLLVNGDPVSSLTYLPASGPVAMLAAGMLQGGIAIFPVEPAGFDVLFTERPATIQTVADLAASPDGVMIASAVGMPATSSRTGGTVTLWDANTGARIVDIQQEFAATVVAFSPDGSLLASGDPMGTIHLWDVSDPTASAEIATLQQHTDAILDLEFSPDGAQLASGSQDGTARLWDVVGAPEDFRALATLDSDTSDPVQTVAFSPDGALLASAGGTFDDGQPHAITLWDVSAPADGTALLAVLNGHTGTVGDVAFSVDGTQLISVGGDRTLRLWTVDETAAFG